jgi:hypothetical protein
MGDLGLLGDVDHFAYTNPGLTVSMIGRQYRVVTGRVSNGTWTEEPIDGRVFDSIKDARAALTKARSEQVQS